MLAPGSYQDEVEKLKGSVVNLQEEIVRLQKILVDKSSSCTVPDEPLLFDFPTESEVMNFVHGIKGRGGRKGKGGRRRRGEGEVVEEGDVKVNEL